MTQLQAVITKVWPAKSRWQRRSECSYGHWRVWRSVCTFYIHVVFQKTDNCDKTRRVIFFCKYKSPRNITTNQWCHVFSQSDGILYQTMVIDRRSTYVFSILLYLTNCKWTIPGWWLTEAKDLCLQFLRRVERLWHVPVPRDVFRRDVLARGTSFTVQELVNVEGE